MVTLESLKQDNEVECFINNAQRQLDALRIYRTFS